METHNLGNEDGVMPKGRVLGKPKRRRYSPEEIERAGNTTTSGWNAGTLTTGGSHSVSINDLKVTNSSRGFDHYIGDDIASHRFSCDTKQQRCYYPNKNETGLENPDHSEPLDTLIADLLREDVEL
jgi:hypothetical protein